jgi:ferrous-iron efflux pump FieF
MNAEKVPVETNDTAATQRIRRHATYASLVVAGVLILAKFVAFLLTDSVALLSSLFDSTFDLLASFITAYGVARAMRPPDHDHRFGYGKAEPLAAFVQAIFVIGSSLFLGYEAIARLLYPRPIENDAVGIGVMILAIVLTAGLVQFQKHVIQKTGSTAIKADRLHYVGDLAVNLAVIVAIVLRRRTGIDLFDPLFALGITLGLLFSAYRIVTTAMGALMDQELPQSSRYKIRDIVLCQKGVHGLHDMRTRTDGERVFVEIHVEMDAAMSLLDAHDLAEKISEDIKAEIPNAEALIHQEPAGVDEKDRLDAKIEALAQKEP